MIFPSIVYSSLFHSVMGHDHGKYNGKYHGFTTRHGAEEGWDVQGLVNVSIKHQPVGVHKQYWNVVAIDNM